MATVDPKLAMKIQIKVCQDRLGTLLAELTTLHILAVKSGKREAIEAATDAKGYVPAIARCIRDAHL